MPPVLPSVSKRQVDKAGESIVDPTLTPKEWGKAFDVIGNWRAAHAYPADQFRAVLEASANKFDPTAIVTQRLKRERSIAGKLLRERYRLTQFQDIAGCRATVADMPTLLAVTKDLLSTVGPHEIVGGDNYISDPRATGYRGMHLVWRFRSDEHPALDGMLCEMQVRTTYQNMWASTVELCSFFKNQDLKSGLGNERWLRFFKLFAAAIASVEGSPPVPGIASSYPDIRSELVDIAVECKILDWIRGYRSTLDVKHFTSPGAGYYYLVRLDSNEQITETTAFPPEQFKLANEAYRAGEAANRDNPSVQVALVSAASIEEMKEAYSSFFGATSLFALVLEWYINPEAADELLDKYTKPDCDTENAEEDPPAEK